MNAKQRRTESRYRLREFTARVNRGTSRLIARASAPCGSPYGINRSADPVRLSGVYGENCSEPPNWPKIIASLPRMGSR